MVQRLGLTGFSPAQCKMASAMWLMHPVVPTEAALIMSGVQIITRSRTVDTINTAPPDVRMRKVLRGKDVCMAAVDTYMARPSGMEAMPARP